MPDKLRPWTACPHVLLKGCSKTARVRDILNCVWIKTCQDQGAAYTDMGVAKGLFADVSQSWSRRCFGPARKISLGCNTLVYSFQEDRVLHPKELLLSLGYRRLPQLRSLSASKQLNLVGEAINLPSLATVLYPLILMSNLPGLWEHEFHSAH